MRITIQIDRTPPAAVDVRPPAVTGTAGWKRARDAGPAPTGSAGTRSAAAGRQPAAARSAGPAPTFTDRDREAT
jgi:hypothetical protein